MKHCKACGKIFQPKRKEQILCSVLCRQKFNGAKVKGKNTGRRKKQYKERLTKDGYLRRYAPDHPYANGRKEIMVHVLVMEMHIGRALRETECIHHKNGIKTDNRLENLELMDHSEHSRMHNRILAKRRQRTEDGKFT